MARSRHNATIGYRMAVFTYSLLNIEAPWFPPDPYKHTPASIFGKQS